MEDYKFDTDAKLYISLNNFIHNKINNSYTKALFEPEYLNQLDRIELAQEFVRKYASEHNEDDVANEKTEAMISFIAKEIDRLIPKMYFLEIKKTMCEKYTAMFVRRIFDIEGKNGLDVVDRIEYKYNHDFTNERQYINSSIASDSQISFLRELGNKKGYLLWHEKYLSAAHARQLIAYLKEEKSEEPAIFSFFFVSK